MSDSSKQHALMVPPPLSETTHKDLPTFPKVQQDFNEIDLFDIVFAIKRQWLWMVVPAIVAPLVAAGYAFTRSTHSVIKATIEIAPESELGKFTLKRIPAGENDVLSLPEFSVIDRTLIQKAFRKTAETKLYLPSPAFDLNTTPFLDMPKTDLIPIEAKGHSSEHVHKALLSFLDDSQTELRNLALSRIQARRSSLSVTIDRLVAERRDILERKIVQKTKDMVAARSSIQYKIQMIETESRFNHKIELEKLNEQKKIEKIFIEQELAEHRANLQPTRLELINLYENAIATAESLGIERPFVGITESKENSEKFSLPLDPTTPLYLKGFKALRMELQFIRSQEADALLAPRIRPLEIKLKMLSDGPEYQVLNARSHPEDFNTQLPALRTQLEALEKDPEIQILQKLLEEKDPKLLLLKEQPFINAERVILSSLEPLIDETQFVRLTHVQTDMPTLAKKGIMIFMGVFVGLMAGCVLACLRDAYLRRIKGLLQGA